MITTASYGIFWIFHKSFTKLRFHFLAFPIYQSLLARDLKHINWKDLKCRVASRWLLVRAPFEIRITEQWVEAQLSTATVKLLKFQKKGGPGVLLAVLTCTDKLFQRNLRSTIHQHDRKSITKLNHKLLCINHDKLGVVRILRIFGGGGKNMLILYYDFFFIRKYSRHFCITIFLGGGSKKRWFCIT